MPALIAKTAAWIVFLGACLFLPAGTVDWPMGWAVIGGYAAVVLAAFMVVDHDLLHERAKTKQRGAPLETVLALVSGLLLYPVMLAVAGLDQASGWTSGLAFVGVFGSAARSAGLAGFFVGYALVLGVMRSNRFFTTVVRMQEDRGHRLVDRGPYAWVRHPGYAGTIFAHLGMAFALGSGWAAMVAGAGAITLAARIPYEERMLSKHLDGYEAYRRRVRWRLLPWVW